MDMPSCHHCLHHLLALCLTNVPLFYCMCSATADARNAQGQSLLSIAVQRDDDKMVEFLLTHWKTCDKER
jgi:hypothetical protein